MGGGRGGEEGRGGDEVEEGEGRSGIWGRGEGRGSKLLEKNTPQGSLIYSHFKTGYSHNQLVYLLSLQSEAFLKIGITEKRICHIKDILVEQQRAGSVLLCHTSGKIISMK